MELTENLEAKVIENGGITVPSQLFYDIVRKAPGSSEISLKKDKKTDQLYVFFGKSKFSLSTLPVDDFPEMDDENLEISLEIESKELSNLIDKSKFCMGVDESRQYLNGIYLHQSGEVISTVATDGHRHLKHTCWFQGFSKSGLEEYQTEFGSKCICDDMGWQMNQSLARIICIGGFY